MLSYAVAGTAAQALFLSSHGTSQLPQVWLLVALASAVAVAAVNTAGRYLNVVRLFVWASLISTLALFLLLVAQLKHIPYVAYGLYVWKDIYIIVLVELFWTFANIAFGVRTATRTYGLFCAAGSLGAIAGSEWVSVLAQHIGTVAVMWTLIPILLLGAWGCTTLAHKIQIPMPAGRLSVTQTMRHSLGDGLDVLRKSPYLLLLMGLVAIVQVVLTLNDFQFNAAVQATYTTLDARTVALADVGILINIFSFVLQMATGLLLRFVGMPITMLAIPTLLCVSLGATLWQPQYSTAALCQIVGKCTDYSLFRACKEILYIPLSYAEKTRGKALVDIFVYRVAKGGVGLFLLALTGLGTHFGVKLLTLGLCGVWLMLAWRIVRRYKRLQPGGPGSSAS
ncbi:hypothetical protein Q3G72_034455 [Acer saccharum]|nr:hypothetical protein Q3G72_034455 [Acer saccharum]